MKLTMKKIKQLIKEELNDPRYYAGKTDYPEENNWLRKRAKEIIRSFENKLPSILVQLKKDPKTQKTASNDIQDQNEITYEKIKKFLADFESDLKRGKMEDDMKYWMKHREEEDQAANLFVLTKLRKKVNADQFYRKFQGFKSFI